MITDPPKLMDELCIKLGICLELSDRGRIAMTQYRDVDALEAAVLEGAGLDPLTLDRVKRFELQEMLKGYWI